MAKQEPIFRDQFAGWLNARRVAYGLLSIALLVLVLGYLSQLEVIRLGKPAAVLVNDLYANVTLEFIGIALTVIVIDSLNERRAESQQKEALVLQMGSPDNAFAVEAVRILRARRWGFVTDKALEGAWLTQANLQGAALEGANLQASNLRWANLQEADLHQANLQKTNLLGANLQGVLLNQASLIGAVLNDALLQGTNLSWAKLQAAQLNKAHLQETILSQSNLQGAQLKDANLQGAQMDGADISAADLSGANLEGAILSRANLEGTYLVGAKLRGALLEGARLNSETELPDGARWTANTDLARFTDPQHPDFWGPSTQAQGQAADMR